MKQALAEVFRDNRPAGSIGLASASRKFLNVVGMMPRSGLLLVVLFALSIAACTGDADTQPSPTAVVTKPAPDELIGDWHTTLVGESISLTIERGTYLIVRGSNSGSGLVEVVGPEITFHGSALCSGTGTYRWAIDADRLTFTALGPDPCTGRSSVLLNATYEQ